MFSSSNGDSAVYSNEQLDSDNSAARTQHQCSSSTPQLVFHTLGGYNASKNKVSSRVTRHDRWAIDASCGMTRLWSPISNALLMTPLIHRIQTPAIMAMIASECLLPGPLLDLFRQRQEATSFRRLGREPARNGGSSPSSGPGISPKLGQRWYWSQIVPSQREVELGNPLAREGLLRPLP